MYAVLVALYGYMNPSISDWLAIGDATRSAGAVTMVAILHTAVFVFGLLQLRGSARRTLATELADGQAEHGEEPSPRPSRRSRSRRRARAEHARGGRHRVRGTPSRRGGRPPTRAAASPPGTSAPSWAEAGPIGWLRARINETPIRPDRSRAPAWRGRRPPEPAGPVDPRRARDRGHEPAHVPGRRARPDALRRGLPRADRHGVPPELALRHRPLDLRVDAPPPREVRDGAAASSCSRVTTSRRAARSGRRSPMRRSSHGARATRRRRAGNRVWVATGDGVRAFDLLTRKPVLDLPIAGAVVGRVGRGRRAPVRRHVDAASCGRSTARSSTTCWGPAPAPAPDEVPVEATQVGTIDGPIERLAAVRRRRVPARRSSGRRRSRSSIHRRARSAAASRSPRWAR